MTPDEIIKSINQLVSLPDAVMRANELLDDPDSNTEEIGEVLGHDPALCAQLLKLVNSAFYNFPKQIDTVSRAITLIGLLELRSLIVASASARCFNQLSSELVDIDAFWQRSVFCGLVAKKLALRTGKASGESMFLAGLLHDVGRLILFTALQTQAKEILQRADQTGAALTKLEIEILGFTSQELGSTLLESWQLPKKLWEPIRYQNHPAEAREFPAETELLQLAQAVTTCIEPELKTGQPLKPDQLQLDDFPGSELSCEDLTEIISETSLESFEVLAIINPQSTIVH